MTRRRSAPSVDAFDQVYVNKGEEDEMEIVFYRTSKLKLVVVWIAIVLSLFFIRLIFYWRRDWYAKSVSFRCSPNAQADWVILKDKSMQQFAHRIHTQILSATKNQNPRKSISRMDVGSKLDSTPDYSIQTYFFHQRLKYILNAKGNCFEKMSVPPLYLSSLLTSNGLTLAEQHSRRWLFGENSIRVHVTPIIILLVTQALNPFYVFQLFSILLWTAGESYYYYAGCIGLLTIVSLAAQIIQQRMMERALKNTIGVNKSCIVWRADLSEWTEVPAETLVPGDVIQIPEAVDCNIPCDVILTSGDCIMNESMLTGESVPVTKVALEASESDVIFDPKQHSRHVLFSGTSVIQQRRGAGDEVVKGVVYRTGFSTSKGELVRSILFPKPIDFKFTNDSYKYVGFLATLALIGMIYTIIVKKLNGDPAEDIVIRTLDLVTIVVPPALPAAMTCGIVFAQFRLRRSRIFCISPNTINVCGSIDAFCFDKTGTLTEDGLDLLSIRQAAPDGSFEENLDLSAESKQKETGTMKTSNNKYHHHHHHQVNSDVLEAMATCHSLALINGTINGDPLDIKMFQFTDWDFEETNVRGQVQGQGTALAPIIVRPKPNLDPRYVTAPVREIGILRQFTFSSKLQRMSVVTHRRTIASTGGASRADDLTLFTKGSPEMVASFCRPQTVPDNYESVLNSYTSQGFRVIALAMKELFGEATTDALARVRNLTRDECECGLTFLGFLVMENRLKTETIPVIHQLKMANIRTIMVTGDNMLTALSVARTCGMLTMVDQVIIASVSGSSSDRPSEIFWCPVEMPKATISLTSLETNGDLEKNLPEVNSRVSFAVTGRSWALLRQHFPQFLPRIALRGIVFARFSPDQKKQLVEELQRLGYYVGMCGDGANDCGALKTAHAGISLSEAEASVASPFTSKDPNISCVLSLIREGRASLVTSFGIFKYMAGYSMTQFLIVCIITWPSVGSTMSDFQFLYEDLFLVTTLVFTFCFTGPYASIAPRPPMISLIAMAPVTSLLCCMCLNLGVMLFSWFYTKAQPWYEEPDNRDGRDLDDTYVNYDQTVIFLITCTQFVTMATIFAKGSPYRANIFSNIFFLINLLICTAASVIMIFNKWPWWAWLLELKMPPTFAFEGIIVGVCCIHFFVSYLVEMYFVEVFVERWLQPCLSRFVFKERVPYRLAEREMETVPDWPPVSDKSLAEVMEMELATTQETTDEDDDGEGGKKQTEPEDTQQSRRDVIAVSHRSNGYENPAFEITTADEGDVAMTIDENAYDNVSTGEQSLLGRHEDDRADDVRTDL